MVLHQTINSIGVKIYNGYWYKGYSWQNHLHKSFEFIFVEKGTLKVSVNKEDYSVGAGSAVMVFPYEVHSIKGDEDTVYFVAVFSMDLCESFYNYSEKSIPESHIFAPEKEVVEYLKHYIMKPQDELIDFKKVPDVPFFYLKSCLYALCGSFTNKVNFTDSPRNTMLTEEILDYIEKNYQQDITLKTLSDAICYDYHYISRIFNETFKMNFKVLVNQYRCEKAAILLANTGKTVSDIALSCGFQSVRSFNRVFSEYSSLTPSDYRKSSSKKSSTLP